MKYNEIYDDLFNVSEEYYLAHCISADAAMGAGIAVSFIKNFPQITTLRNDKNLQSGQCVKIDRVFNLITKEKYWNKPTYDSLQQSLESAKNICIENNITKLAMPTIGCGIDQLNWDLVKSIILNIFKDTDMEILVVFFKQKER